MAKLFKTILFLSLLAPCFTHAESSTDEMLKQIQERAAKVKQYRELLGNPDQTVRVAALDVMLKSDDSVMRELAFNQGFASADDAMRAIALKNKITYMKYLNFDLKLTDNPTANEKKAIVEHLSNNYGIAIKGYDANSGAFTFNGSYGKGQVSGIGINLQDNYCNATLTLSEDSSLKGILKCTYPAYKGNYLMELQLQ